MTRKSANYHEWATVVDFDTILDKAKRHTKLAEQYEKTEDYSTYRLYSEHITSANALLSLIEESLFFKASKTSTARTTKKRIARIEKELGYGA